MGEEMNDSFHVHGHNRHEFPAQHLPVAPIAGSPRSVPTDQLSQLSLDLGMPLADFGILAGLSLEPHVAVFRFVFVLDQCAPGRCGRSVHALAL